MKKILMSLVTIAIVGALITGGTMAYFADVETIGVGDIQAGTLDLTVNDQNPCTEHITLHDMKPGDGADVRDGKMVGRSICYCWTLKNIGTIDGQPWVEVGPITNKENGVQEPEKVDPGEDLVAGHGELVDYLKVRWGKRPGYITMTMSGYPGFHTLNSIGEKTIGTSGSDFKGYPFDPLAQDESVCFVIYIALPPDTGNCVQGDSVEFDIIFHLDQITP